MVMVGLGDFEPDAGILVTVKGNQVQLELYPLGDGPFQSLDTYTPQYWQEQAEKY